MSDELAEQHDFDLSDEEIEEKEQAKEDYFLNQLYYE